VSNNYTPTIAASFIKSMTRCVYDEPNLYLLASNFSYLADFCLLFIVYWRSSRDSCITIPNLPVSVQGGLKGIRQKLFCKKNSTLLYCISRVWLAGFSFNEWEHSHHVFFLLQEACRSLFCDGKAIGGSGVMFT